MSQLYIKVHQSLKDGKNRHSDVASTPMLKSVASTPLVKKKINKMALSISHDSQGSAQKAGWLNNSVDVVGADSLFFIIYIGWWFVVVADFYRL